MNKNFKKLFLSLLTIIAMGKFVSVHATHKKLDIQNEVQARSDGSKPSFAEEFISRMEKMDQEKKLDKDPNDTDKLSEFTSAFKQIDVKYDDSCKTFEVGSKKTTPSTEKVEKPPQIKSVTKEKKTIPKKDITRPKQVEIDNLIKQLYYDKTCIFKNYDAKPDKCEEALLNLYNILKYFVVSTQDSNGKKYYFRLSETDKLNSLCKQLKIKLYTYHTYKKRHGELCVFQNKIEMCTMPFNISMEELYLKLLELDAFLSSSKVNFYICELHPTMSKYTSDEFKQDFFRNPSIHLSNNYSKVVINEEGIPAYLPHHPSFIKCKLSDIVTSYILDNMPNKVDKKIKLIDLQYNDLFSTLKHLYYDKIGIFKDFPIKSYDEAILDLYKILQPFFISRVEFHDDKMTQRYYRFAAINELNELCNRLNIFFKYKKQKNLCIFQNDHLICELPFNSSLIEFEAELLKLDRFLSNISVRFYMSKLSFTPDLYKRGIINDDFIKSLLRPANIHVDDFKDKITFFEEIIPTYIPNPSPSESSEINLSDIIIYIMKNRLIF